MSSTQAVPAKAYAIHDTKKWSNFEVIDFEPKKLGDDDVEVKVAYCGVCASDVHTITGGWGEIITPMITGHEIAGIVNRVGKNVKEFKQGDRAGFGAQIGSCLSCKRCKSDNENYCKQGVDTYNAKYPDGQIAHGGYSSVVVGHEQFCFKIPDNVALEHAASMFCGGLTVYSPLVRAGCGKGKRVGVVGIGGLGHYAVMFAKALGADEVIAFSHSHSKEQDVLKMGADKFIATGETKPAESGVEDIDILVSTVDMADAIQIADYAAILNVGGIIANVAMPDDPVSIMMPSLAGNHTHLGVSHIGSKKECYAMLKLASEKNLKPWIELYDMKDAGKAVEKLYGASNKGSVRYRQVLKQDLI